MQYFSRLFHQFSKQGRPDPRAYLDDSQWPKEWLTTFYKTYSRAPQTELPDLPGGSLRGLLTKRASSGAFSGEVLSLEDLGFLLKRSVGEFRDLPRAGNDLVRRAHPSGGGRFPIETYVLVLKGTEALVPGLYHYRIRTHALERVRDLEEGIPDSLFGAHATPLLAGAAAVLFFTADPWRTQSKYGERGYRFILLEAGHIGQNVMLSAAEREMRCCPFGGTRDEEVERYLGIDGQFETLVYTFLVGK